MCLLERIGQCGDRVSRAIRSVLTLLIRSTCCWCFQPGVAEGDASYQSLVDDTRRDMALRYIQDPAKSATDITFLLGYSQQSVFTRAFRRWTGMSPSEYRVSKSSASA